MRKPLIRLITFPFSGDEVNREFIAFLEWAGTTILHTQSGFVRYYLVIIFGAVAGVLIFSGKLSDVIAGQQFFPSDLSVTITDLAKIFMLVLTVTAGVLTVVVREHVKAAIAYGVIGYAIGVIFLIDHTPDVALVPLLVETMATVLIIIMLGRIRAGTRLKVINSLWTGRHGHNFGLLRDLGISIVIGVTVFVFFIDRSAESPTAQQYRRVALDQRKSGKHGRRGGSDRRRFSRDRYIARDCSIYDGSPGRIDAASAGTEARRSADAGESAGQRIAQV